MLASAKESSISRFDSYNVRNSVLIIFHITFRDCRMHIIRNEKVAPIKEKIFCDSKITFDLAQF